MADDQLAATLGSWLSHRRGVTVTVEFDARPSSGFSADNMIFRATADGQTSKHVLRRDTEDGSPYPEQTPGLGNGIVMQASVMHALSGIVPVATNVVVEHDTTILGAGFLVMDFVEGVVPIEHPPCTVEGFFATASPSIRTTMITTGLQALARVHTTPWRARGLAALHDESEPAGARRQLRLWENQLQAGLGDRWSEVFERATGILHAQIPPDLAAEDVVLVWGDARLGNVIWDPSTGMPLCLTDFEGAAVGEREMDLGWWLMADRWMHEGSGVDRLDGEPTRAQQVEIYESAAGVRVANVAWHEMFAAYRFATAVVGVMNRYERTGVMPEGHIFWRDNPATSLLAAIVDELVATHR